jgi:hypothetical protein
MTEDEVADIVFAAKPVFKRIIAEQGHHNLLTYYKSHTHTPRLLPAGRAKELIDEVVAVATETLGEVVAHTVRQQLTRDYTVSTANHHDFLTHPFFANCTLARAAALGEEGVVIALTCGGVSLNNSSFPRGLILHDDAGKEHQLPLISLKNHHHPVYGKSPFTEADLRRASLHAASLDLAPQRADQLRSIFTSVLAHPRTMKSKTLSEQITKVVHALWRRVPGMEKKHVVSIEQETLAARLLVKHHLATKTILHALIFDPETRSSFLEHFEGIQGSHSRAADRGTELFWGVTEKGRVALRVENDSLVNHAAGFSLPLLPNSLKEALASHQLMPSMALTYCILSFYYGIVAGGGFSQVNYLTDMKRAYEKLLRTTPTYAGEARHLAEVRTDYFTGEFHLVLGRYGGRIVPATPIDLILHQSPEAAARIQKSCEEMSLKAAITPMLPELYKIITGENSPFTPAQSTTHHPIAIDL